MIKYLKLGIKLFPIFRSITGSGVNETLKILKKEIKNLKVKKFNQVPGYMIGKSHQNGISRTLMFRTRMERKLLILKIIIFI